MLRGSPRCVSLNAPRRGARGSSLATGARELGGRSRAIERRLGSAPRSRLSRHDQFRVVALHERHRGDVVARQGGVLASPRVARGRRPFRSRRWNPPARRRRVGFDALASAGRVRVRETVTGYVVKDNLERDARYAGGTAARASSHGGLVTDACLDAGGGFVASRRIDSRRRRAR